jgi:hypothetical protein
VSAGCRRITQSADFADQKRWARLARVAKGQSCIQDVNQNGEGETKMVDLEEWLLSIGCGSYIEAFKESGVTADLLGELTGDDLKELGLTLGDRKRFLRAVAQLGEGSADNISAYAQPPESLHHTHAERRRLTVMFVDLIGSTALSSRLDPEECSTRRNGVRLSMNTRTPWQASRPVLAGISPSI